MIDSTLSKRSRIKNKIRLLTKSPSTAQISDDKLNTDIDNFVLYSMPADVSLNSLRQTLRFYTTPHVDLYSTNTTDSDDPLYNLKNIYYIYSSNSFVGGTPIYFTQDYSDFYTRYQRNITSKTVTQGDGGTTVFSGTLNHYPVLPREVVWGTTDLNGNYLKLHDDGQGALSGNGTGTIDYVTGEYDITFDTAPADNEDIYIRSATYTPSKPDTILYYENSFFLRPIPDKTYAVDIDVLKRPSYLTNDEDIPFLSTWWEYIAFGVSRNIEIERGNFQLAEVLGREMVNKEEQIIYKDVIESAAIRS